MNSNDIITLGVDLQGPWKLAGQKLDTKKNPHEPRLADKGVAGSSVSMPMTSKR